MSDDGSDQRSYGTLTTEETFALVGNEVRQEILLALSDPDPDALNAPVLSFSELYSRVDADVNTSHFNYHLQKLLGHFVESRTRDTAHPNDDIGKAEGYALRPEGLLLMWTVRSGTAAVDPDLDAFDAGFDCHHCGERVEAVYENATFVVQCPSCKYHYEYNLTPPGVVHGAADEREVLDRATKYNRTVRGGFARGVCPLCANAVDARFVDADETNYPRKDLREAFVHRNCGHCGYVDYLTVGEFLLQNPVLISFCLDHGVDVVTGPLWEFEFVATDAAVSVEGTDPWEVRFTLTLGDETLEMSIDESLSTTAEVTR